MPLPIDIEVGEGTTISDGWLVLTNKDASRIRILSVDEDGFLKYEISPPKTVIKMLKDYVGIDHFITAETTLKASDGRPLSQYKYFRRSDGSYYAHIEGEGVRPHKIELGRLADRESPISVVSRVIAYKFDTKEFSRKELKSVLPKHLVYGQKIKSLLAILHYEGFLVKEIDQSSRNKAKELYTATDNLKKVIIPSPSPEQP
jgi:hypothetical protein